MVGLPSNLSTSLDPTWLRKLIYEYSGLDLGSPPKAVDLNGTFLQYGVVPVVMATNKARPLNVQPRGFWTGGVVVNDTEENVTQTPFQNDAAATDVSLTNGSYTTIASFTLPAGKTAYFANIYFGINGSNSTTSPAWHIQDTTNTVNAMGAYVTPSPDFAARANVDFKLNMMPFPFSYANPSNSVAANIALQLYVNAAATVGQGGFNGWYQ